MNTSTSGVLASRDTRIMLQIILRQPEKCHHVSTQKRQRIHAAILITEYTPERAGQKAHDARQHKTQGTKPRAAHCQESGKIFHIIGG
jgi:hypothetical protein